MHARSFPIARCRITRTLPSVMVDLVARPAAPSLGVERQEHDHPLAFGEAPRHCLQAIEVERAPASGAA